MYISLSSRRAARLKKSIFFRGTGVLPRPRRRGSSSGTRARVNFFSSPAGKVRWNVLTRDVLRNGRWGVGGNKGIAKKRHALALAPVAHNGEPVRRDNERKRIGSSGARATRGHFRRGEGTNATQSPLVDWLQLTRNYTSVASVAASDESCL